MVKSHLMEEEEETVMDRAVAVVEVEEDMEDGVKVKITGLHLD